ncbi:MAG: MBL fold metallo-hydrolase [Gammaproteobacteria bacterium]|nr:MBL fold metallo-hydrolase [Gammaproteobacteria bacterium]
MKPAFSHPVWLLFACLWLTPVAAEDWILPKPTQISEHVWAWIGPYGGPSKDNNGYRMNLAFVVGQDAVAVLDSGYGPAMANDMLRHIRLITERPVRYVVNSNSQPHRFMGNGPFQAQGATLVAGQEALPRMQASGDAFARTIETTLELPDGSIATPPAPEKLVEDKLTLDLGGVSLEIVAVGQAHTPGSLIVHVPQDNLVYAGDVLYRGRLLSLVSEVSDLEGWLQAWERLEQYPDARFLPGHGEAGPLSDFAHGNRDYLTALLEHMQQAVDAGTDMQSAINAFDSSSWQSLADFEELAGRNAHEAYRQREAAAFGF